MRKIIAMILSITLLFTNTAIVYAFDNPTTRVTDSASFVEEYTGDTITMEKIETFSNAFSRSNLSDFYTYRFYRNGEYEETISVNLSADLLWHEYSDGSVVEERISDIVTYSEVEDYTKDVWMDEAVNTNELSSEISPSADLLNSTTDYVAYEPMIVDSVGIQKMLPDVASYSGYQAMGYRGGYYFAPTLYGYLQRLGYGPCGYSTTHNFSFDAGTAIATAASIVISLFTSIGWALVLSIGVTIISALIDVITYDYSLQFRVTTYKWLYRVRLNSNTGEIIYSTNKTRDYLRGYKADTGERYYEYCGTAYDTGFMLANTEMIRIAINDYLLTQ